MERRSLVDWWRTSALNLVAVLAVFVAAPASLFRRRLTLPAA